MMTIFAGLAMSPLWGGVVSGDPSGLKEAYQPIRVAVLVGVQEYSDPKLQGLRFTSKDARDLGDVLASETGGDFDRVVVIEGAAATTARGIQRAIDLASADLQRDDTFVLYLSGHGTLTLDPLEGSQLWFLPSDGVLDSPQQTGLGVEWLEDRVNEMPARRRVLIMDTCHNGRSDSKSAVNEPTSSTLRSMRGEPPAPRNLKAISESEARLFAAQYYQPAMEDSALENGVYTHFLLRSLTDQSEAADLNRDGLVDVTEAHDFARDRTIQYTGGMQVPRAEYRIVGREEIYLSGNASARKEAEKALVSAYDEVLANGTLVVDGQPRGGLPGLTAVDPGRHEIVVQSVDGRTLLSRRVTLEAGQILSLETLFEKKTSSVVLMAGPKLRQGPGANHFHPWGGEIELGWMDPVQLARPIRTELHLRGSTSWGSIPEQGEWNVWSGEASIGGSLGLRRGDFSIGPMAELVFPWRNFENDSGIQQQGTLAAGLGARMLWSHSLASGDLVLRLDSRVVPFEHDGEPTHLWHHGFSVGWGGSP